MRKTTIIHKYIVRVSSHHTILVNARNAENAKKQAWASIKNGYTYGYDSEADLVAHATAKRVS